MAPRPTPTFAQLVEVISNRPAGDALCFFLGHHKNAQLRYDGEEWSLIEMVTSDEGAKARKEAFRAGRIWTPEQDERFHEPGETLCSHTDREEFITLLEQYSGKGYWKNLPATR